MGMNEDEFWNSNPIFFNKMADIYLEKKKKEAKQISNLFK